MSNAENTSTNRPVDGSFRPMAFGLGVQFHPSIKLDRKKGMEFSPKLSSAIDARTLDLQETRWVFEQPIGSHPNGKFRVTVEQSELSVEAEFPTESEELFEHRYSVILSEFQRFFKPELLLGFASLVRGTLDVDGDARLFLSQYVTPYDNDRLRQLGRPVHLFGLRLFMPPFKVSKPAPPKGKAAKKPSKAVVSTTDWMVDVKAESLMDDTSKLFLEAQGQWQSPAKWDAKATAKAVGGGGVVSAYLKERFISFLTYEPN